LLLTPNDELVANQLVLFTNLTATDGYQVSLSAGRPRAHQEIDVPAIQDLRTLGIVVCVSHPLVQPPQ
jgi:hypothetical protein